MTASPVVLIVMGVSGAGKSSIAESLHDRLGWPFQEGDDLHPAANVRKMHAGIALTDEDRAPWLAAVRGWIDERLAAGDSGLITCSALKRAYRDFLIAGRSGVRILYLKAEKSVLEDRVAHRQGHFMPATLLESQLATLEEPQPDENPIIIRVDGAKAQSMAAALSAVQAL